MKNFLVSMFVILGVWFIYENWGSVTALFFLVWAQFMVVTVYVGKNIQNINLKIDNISLEYGRLRSRIECIEGSILGNRLARKRYRSLMENDKYQYFPDDEEDQQYVKYYIGNRDGELSPKFTSYCGASGLESRLRAVEEKLGIKTDDSIDIDQ